ncbi:6480_t:CDS:2 [Entrophospora sp. SA101]|nr:6480_t:CDS:2 [Entrophospora sp. SA101]
MEININTSNLTLQELQNQVIELKAELEKITRPSNQHIKGYQSLHLDLAGENTGWGDCINNSQIIIADITKSIRQKELGKGYVTDSDGNESEFKHETVNM